jgi:hypothetical protein
MFLRGFKAVSLQVPKPLSFSKSWSNFWWLSWICLRGTPKINILELDSPTKGGFPIGKKTSSAPSYVLPKQNQEANQKEMGHKDLACWLLGYCLSC